VGIALVAFTLLTGCVSRLARVGDGLQSSFEGFVPGRIALLPCRLWPAAGVLASWPTAVVTPRERQDFCARVDQFVLDGFKDQPLMKGISPQLVGQLLERAGRKDLPDQIEQVWRRLPEDCFDCDRAASFYTHSIRQRPEWRAWLADLGMAAANSDAVLIPWIYYFGEERVNERGLLVSRRRLGAGLFLLSTQNGEMIWSGSRDGLAQNHVLARPGSGAAWPEFPAWEQVYASWSKDVLWREFPGRQVQE
jgi:hypothetical protein